MKEDLIGWSNPGFAEGFIKGDLACKDAIDNLISTRHDKAVLDGKLEISLALKEILDQVRAL